METVSATTQDDNPSANPSSVKSEDGSPQHDSSRGSPPPNCAICLGTCRNKSFTDSCLHQFCFICLLRWSKVKAECPLCKQNFRSIIYNVRSNHQYEEYMVEQRTTEETTERIDLDNRTITTGRVRFRTTVTLPRRETIAFQQLLLHYPLITDVFPPPARAPLAHRRRSPASFRRTVYRHNLWARPLPDFTGRFRDCSPEFYRYNDSQMHRLVPWLTRELNYLLNENVSHISYVTMRILELLPQYHINSTEFREAVHSYFGERTDHFLHELYCFASTPYDMTGYDRNVQYTTDTRISSMVNEVISSSDSEASVDSDIVMVTSSEPAEPPPGPSRIPAPVYPQSYIPQPTNNVIPIETISQSDTDDDSSEVMVVGYIKPPQDRTPEVVDLLGSDSDVIVQDTTQPEASQSSSTNGPLVKVSLKRHKTWESHDSDSDDTTYRPPSLKRKKRVRSNNSTTTTTDTCRSTPSPDDSFSSYSSDSSSSILTSESDTESDFETAEDRIPKILETKAKKKQPKETVTSGKEKKKNKRASHGQHKGKKNDKEKQSKRKSQSGKGVKSSNKSNEPIKVPEEQTSLIKDEPGTSGLSSVNNNSKRDKKYRRKNRENKRLRSVVNVMYSKANTGESTSTAISTSSNGFSRHTLSSAVENESASASDTSRKENLAAGAAKPSTKTGHKSTRRELTDNLDNEDDLPLNLTIHKTDPPQL